MRLLAMAASLTVLVMQRPVRSEDIRVKPVRGPLRGGRERIRPPETSRQIGSVAPDSAKTAIPSAQPTVRNLANHSMGICLWP